MTQVISFTNVTPSSTPPDYYRPSAAGVAVPANLHNWQMNIDCTNIPASSTFAFDVEYHYASGWQLDTGGVFGGGQVQDDNGNPAGFIHTLSSSIGSVDANGNLVAYPDHMRIHVKSYGGWLLPSLTFDIT